MDEYEPNDSNTAGWSPSSSSTTAPLSVQPSEQPPICLGEISPSHVNVIQQQQQQQQQYSTSTQQASNEGGGGRVGEQPVKVRKKPGRKPNPASPALRKAQNRAAQRAFRERKERHLRDLETTIKSLREKHHAATKELQTTQAMLDSFRVENWYLKGVVLTLQFVCMHHHILIPSHSPYLSEEALSEMAHSSPHAIESYVNAYTLNNVNLKPAMASHFANNAYTSNNSMDGTQRDEDMQYEEHKRNTTQEPATPSPSPPSSESIIIKHEDSEDEDGTSFQQQQHQQQPVMFQPSPQQPKEANPWQQQQQQHQQSPAPQESLLEEPRSLSAIQKLRLQLRCQSRMVMSGCPKSAARLQPTLLQLAIPHDSRIDLIPAPHMRDRMIIFRDQMDYDRCFSLLLNGAVQHGEDPTLAQNWELPPEFFSEFWYLTIDYDLSRTNKWRRAKGLPDIGDAGNDSANQYNYWSSQQQQHEPSKVHHDQAWADEMLSQLAEGMPTLQPVDHSKAPHLHYPEMIISASPEDYQHQLGSSSICK